MNPYLFTDENGKIIEMGRFMNGAGAAIHRNMLQIQKPNLKILSWCHMGGENLEPNLPLNVAKE